MEMTRVWTSHVTDTVSAKHCLGATLELLTMNGTLVIFENMVCGRTKWNLQFSLCGQFCSSWGSLQFHSGSRVLLVELSYQFNSKGFLLVEVNASGQFYGVAEMIVGQVVRLGQIGFVKMEDWNPYWKSSNLVVLKIIGEGS